MKILEAFGSIEIQGAGRLGVRKFGVPQGGWFDASSAMAANVLVQRPKDSLCLELAMARLTFVPQSRLEFAVTGAPCTVWSDGRRMGQGGLFSADPDEQIRIDPLQEGVRTYLSARFLDLPPAGTQVRVGDSLPVQELRESPRRFRLPEENFDGPIRIVAGPQARLFDLPAFASSAFTVSPKSNRVGLRLAEPFQAHAHELPSEPAGCGAIQVTPDGSVIVLGPEGPTIGGYPKIAYVISGDFDRLAQLRPGRGVTWERVDLDAARRLAQERTASLDRRLAELAQAARIL